MSSRVPRWPLVSPNRKQNSAGNKSDLQAPAVTWDATATCSQLPSHSRSVNAALQDMTRCRRQASACKLTGAEHKLGSSSRMRCWAEQLRV